MLPGEYHGEGDEMTLPAGVLRCIKLSGAWVRDSRTNRPYYVYHADDPSNWALYEAVEIRGPSRMMNDGRRAWLETEAELHVQP